ncbi:MAG TPA: thiamine pyrophosphate-dependent enzyme, partial [Thermoplasmataceae archaeon]|nr:thiamine pyrophosphate-dependent enzyme [Thermoplasmataceae archaeon]
DFLPDGVKTIQVDINRLNLGKRFHADLALVCTAEHFLKSVKPDSKDEKFYDDFQDEKESWINDLKKSEESQENPIKPERVAATLEKYSDENSVVVIDTGNVTVWGMRNFRSGTKHTYLFSPWLGSMGVGIPGAVGASFATDRQVIAMVGDGSFAMTMMELITARKYSRPIKVVVFNNSKLGMIKFEQEVMGFPEWGVDLLNPDFAQLARSMGIEGLKVEESNQLDEGVKKLLATKGPAVLEVIVNGEERPMPPRLTFKQVRGYITSLFREELMEHF